MARWMSVTLMVLVGACGDGGAKPEDLSVAGDLVMRDLALPGDLAVVADLMAVPDLVSPEDLVTPADLRRPPDLAAAAKAPLCDKIGSKSEGWYAADGSLICWAQCSGAVAQCRYVGTRSEGWYSSNAGAGCMGMDLIEWAQCG